MVNPVYFLNHRIWHRKSGNNISMWYKMANQKTLIMMRGISGSGKSTKAQELGEGGVVFGADEFWGPNYDFDRARIGEAHEWNQNRVREAIEAGISPIVVDNTNTQMWEMRPYVEAAVEHGYNVEFHEPDTPWKFDAEELVKRNRHNVPMDIIQQMLMNWEKNPTVEGVLKAELPKPTETPEVTTESPSNF